MTENAHQRSQVIMLFFAFSFGMILSNLLGQSKVGDENQAEEVLMTYQGFDKTFSDLPSDLAEKYQDVTQALESRQRQILSTVALKWQIEDYAAKHQLTMQDAAHQLFAIEKPDGQAISDFYEQEKDVIGKPFFEVRGSIEKHLMVRQAKRARQEALATLMERGDLAILPYRPPLNPLAGSLNHDEI